MEITARLEPTNRLPKESAEPAILTVEGTATHLWISVHSGYTLRSEGKLPVVHPVPRRTLVVKRRLDEMLMDGTLGVDLATPKG